jgi:hypothetical protein
MKKREIVRRIVRTKDRTEEAPCFGITNTKPKGRNGGYKKNDEEKDSLVQ